VTVVREERARYKDHGTVIKKTFLVVQFGINSTNTTNADDYISGILRRVVWILTLVSDVLTASIFRAI
jgi:hypothetical protein